ncbi:cupin domain-containing protein [Bradyrhizobium sp. Ec3.3]|uniref:cupin domain-containing protein n=1 Tax=Bradyrhizobium sp. Ec3.3 TaxID=189753 RepID=UPI0004883DD3|nr:cupin domain-containing protein [Bradyrhizobium sp. Ec3.3]
MPVFRSDQAPPAWCELRSFEIIDLTKDQNARYRRSQSRERLLMTLGTIQLVYSGGSVVLNENQFIDLPVDEWSLKAYSPRAQIVRLSGRWGDDVAGCGIFRVSNQEDPTHVGDPVSYPKATSVDSHYHDCDEYWIVLEGSCTTVVGDRHMTVNVGDCVPIGMGHHHDMPSVTAPVKAVFFETTLEGEKRVGHLWNHTHGQARPKHERL